MDVNQVTFGVESETHIPSNCSIERQPWHSHRPMRYNDGHQHAPLNGWRAEHDSSLVCSSGRKTVEFISPVLQGIGGLHKLHAALTCLRTVVGANTNSSCGTHVHVGFPQDADAVRRLLHIVAKHEAGLFAACGTPDRENGSYTRAIKHMYNPDRLIFRKSFDRWVCDQDLNTKFRSINLSLWMNGGATVEFRIFSNTVMADKVVAWTRLCVGMVEKALSTTRRAKWHHNDKALVMRNSKGDAQSSLKLLMYDMGWIKGRAFIRDHDNPNADKHGRIPVIWGNLVDDGLPTIQQSHNTLKKLADAYEHRKVSDYQ